MVVDGALFIPSGGTYTADELDVTVVKQNGSVVATEAYVVSAIDAIPDVIDATETVKGIVELATIAEVQTGTDTTRAVTPAGMKAGLNATGTAPIYACRAWVTFNGTGTVEIRASGNVSSITDNGVGTYTVNFTTAMPDINASIVANSDSGSGTGNKGPYLGSTSATSAGIYIYNSSGSLVDTSIIDIAVFR